MKDNNREKSLFKNTLIISIGMICTKLVTFLLLPLYTGILTTEEYGMVDLLNTLISLLLPIVTFQIEQAVFRELIEIRNDKEKSKEIISSAIFSVIIQCIVFLIIFLLVSMVIENKYKNYLVFNVIANIFASLFLQIARGLGDTKRYSIGSFITALSTIIFSILFLVAINMRADGMLLATLLGQLSCVIYLFVFLKLYKYISFKQYDFKLVKKLWKYSLPLIPNAISWWIFSSSDRVIVSSVLGLSMNGILSVATKFSTIYITLYNIFDRSWIESISLHINDIDIEDYFNRMFNMILKIFVSLLLLLTSFMPIIYPIMIDKSYSYGFEFVPILLIASLFTVCQGLLAVVYAAKKDTKSIAKTSIIAAILNIIIHIGLVKYIGLYAAAISTLLSYLMIFLYRLYDIKKRYLKVNISSKVLISSIVILPITLMLYYGKNIYCMIINIILTIVFSIVLNKDLLKLTYDFIKNKFLVRSERNGN